ncbi:excinuclease ABC subunit A [candidate division LCP-89 bacterium B3_LCP]|uniref:UvrABC system protein A n=1 Tax=candidate division LCP-89 bacterium B3_LCP TaxID=2012998 RepID=A0A532UXN6_UNCL8|nr:MAG: excinuclease ABC subunit A [candidate division LCP-89 bacterium B3_LCP]
MTNPPFSDSIVIKGAREHNLKNIDLTLPRNKLIVITGISGSGKSSLAFDTLYAEGQRRYVESLSAYARQFLGLMEKPDVDFIEGLSPAISIEQKSTHRNPRSTVATVTEIYDYLRLLYARIGKAYCYECGRPIEKQSVQNIVDRVLELESGTRFVVLAPIVRGRKGEYREILSGLKRDGYLRVRIDGKTRSLDETISLDKNKKHNIDVVIDRLAVEGDLRIRLTDSVETALRLSSGLVIVDVQGGSEILFSEHYNCPDCGISYEELEPRSFSFNSPYGACSTCSGLGFTLEIDPQRIVPDPFISVRNGAIATLSNWNETMWLRMLETVADHFNFSLSGPFSKLAKKDQDICLYGSGKEEIRFKLIHKGGRGSWEHTGVWEGVIPNLKRRYRQTTSTGIREWIEGFMSALPCPGCKGGRLKPEALSVKVADYNISNLTELSIKDSLRFFQNIKLSSIEQKISQQILKEINARLQFLVDVGLDYLTLDRSAGTISGGEAQRIRLATQIGSQLVGVLYILDEPSIGLHQRDNKRLIETLKHLRDQGNTIIVVEHDHEMINSADIIVDLGPGAGRHGGQVVSFGRPSEVAADDKSITGRFLSGKEQIEIPPKRRKGNKKRLSLFGATGNNLKSVNLHLSLGSFVCVTGVSGSGKSTLLNETLYKALCRNIYKSKDKPLPFKRLTGVEFVDKVINIDQSPIGRTPRSNPATYTGLFTPIRDLFSELKESKKRGYKPGRFSFNVKGGRCEACHGDGIIKIEMHFLPDVYIPCEVCKSKRYNRETLEIKYRGKSIADVLDMTAEEALEFFHAHPVIRRKLETIVRVGLGYIHLGQQATTLSGGEAQRVKLSTELSKIQTGNTLYLLDEPTTGLHFADIRLLLSVLHELVEKGNTVLVIEHNLDVIKTADYIVDLGPEGGDEGGRIIARGTPESLAKSELSYTGRFLRQQLHIGKPAEEELIN